MDMHSNLPYFMGTVRGWHIYTDNAENFEAFSPADSVIISTHGLQNLYELLAARWHMTVEEAKEFRP